MEVLLVRRVLAHWVGDVGLVALVARHRLNHVGGDDLLESGRLRGIALSVAGRLVGRGLVVIGPGNGVVLSRGHTLVCAGLLLAVQVLLLERGLRRLLLGRR